MFIVFIVFIGFIVFMCLLCFFMCHEEIVEILGLTQMNARLARKYNYTFLSLRQEKSNT